MVRVKHRWLLVRIDFTKELLVANSEFDKCAPDLQAKEIHKEIVKSLNICFGLSVHSFLSDIVVKHIDQESRLCMIRVLRDSANRVRAAITLLTNLYNEGIVASVISIQGSSRTARLAAMHEIRKRETLQRKTISQNELLQLERRLQAVRDIDC
jgi:RNase P/RNase MRP subunit POP5